MNESANPRNAEKSRDTYRKNSAQLGALGQYAELPESMRTFAEHNIAQTREVYERSKDALEAVLVSWERTFDAASQGATAPNRKVVDITQRNLATGFEFASNLAGAKNLTAAMELQTAYWRQQLNMLGSQAEEMSTLSSKIAADITEPLKAQASRGMQDLRKTS